MSNVAGIVLCGGQSSRMGRPKAWLPFGNEVMLTRVVRLLGEVVTPLVVVAAPGQEVPALPAGVEVVRDPERGRGPLQGLAAGLEALQGRAQAAYLSSCDVPFLQPVFVRRLLDLLGDHAICVPRVGGYLHPLAAVYRLEVAAVAARLGRGEDLIDAVRGAKEFVTDAIRASYKIGAGPGPVDPWGAVRTR